MGNKVFDLPNGLTNHRMQKNVDSVSFKVVSDCTFCYSDPTPCFPSGGFMAAGSYTATNPPTTYGPFTPNQAGTVLCGDSIPPNPCSTSSLTATASSITVDS